MGMRPAKTTIVAFLTNVVTTVAGFVATLFIARFLGPAPLGQYSIVLAVMFWVYIVPRAVERGINKRVSEGTDRGAFLTAGFTINAALLVVLTVSILAIAAYVNDLVGATVAVPLVLLLAGYFAMNNAVAGLRGQKKVAEAEVVGAIARVLRTTFQIALVFAGWKLVGLVVGHAAALIVAAAVAFTQYSVGFERPTMAHVRSLAAYARYAWAGMLSARAFGWLDTLVLAFFVSTSLVGVYEVAWTVASTLVLLNVAVSQTLFPNLSELSAKEDYDQVAHLLDEGLVFAGLFTIPGLVGAAVVGDRVLRIYGPSFTEGHLVLVLLVLARLVNVYGGQFVNTINAIDRPEIAFRINGLFIVANAALNVALVWAYGWVGAAVATVASATLMLVLAYHFLHGLIPLSVPVSEISVQVVASLVMAAVTIPLVEFVPRSHYTTVLVVAVAAAIYTAAILALSSRVRTKMQSLLPPSLA